jgi:hypothetical protein
MAYPNSMVMRRRRRKATPYKKQVMKRVYVPRNIRTGGYMNIEKKFFDTARANVLPVSFATGQFSPLTLNCLYAPTQGTGPSNRVGNKTLIHSLHFKGEFKTELLTDSSSTSRLQPAMYLAIVLDQQSNGAQALPTDVWATPLSNQQDLSPFRNIENGKRFKVLHSEVITVPLMMTQRTATNYSTVGSRAFVNINKNFKKPIEVRHIANGGTVADIAENSLQVFAYVRDAAHSDQFIYQARIRFSG